MVQRKIRNPKQVIRAFVQTLNERYPLDAVILYGSYARGWQNEWSDIDLAVISPAFDTRTAVVWRRVRDLALTISPQLDVRPYGRKAFAQFESGDFLHEVQRTGRPIYRNGRFRWSIRH